MEIGAKIKELRLKNRLTQEELADRCELTKGYISQLENDLTSPSINTLVDLMQNLGSNLAEFFNDEVDEQIVFSDQDMFIKEWDNQSIKWLVHSAQKNAMEPILTTIKAGTSTDKDLPHDGEEFGYILSGEIEITVGKRKVTAGKENSFYFRSNKAHFISNIGKDDAVIIWVSCPPNF